MLTSVRRLLFGFQGRIPRAPFWGGLLALGAVFAVLLAVVEPLAGRTVSLLFHPVLLWGAVALATKRLHDRGRSAAWLLLAALPLLGPLWLALVLVRRGTPGENRYGPDPLAAGADYLTVGNDAVDERGQPLVDDVTRLNPTAVSAVITPTTVEEIQAAVRGGTGPLSIGGGHFSMGGQTASPGSLHLDMRRLNQVLEFSPVRRTIRVQAGIRWCDIQRFVDPHGLAVKIMQTYANFTVGGSLSVNVHGRYAGEGPVSLSVRAIRVVLASGDVVDATPTNHAEIFYGAIGGYGALGVIVEAELDLAENTRVERVSRKIAARDYVSHFHEVVRGTPGAVFHNGDLYAPHYRTVRTVTWVQTERRVTVPYRLQPHRRAYPLETYFFWAISETPFGKWRREFILDPILYLRRKVHWRNYEAGYDVAELEPPSRKHRTYVLQEYFVPLDRLYDFLPRMVEVFQRHRVNVLNVSLRHARPDPGSLLAWARTETVALVVYYKQRTRPNAKERVAVWTREMIDAALAVGGTYYLPYQAHATAGQFHAAYPRARELFALKRKLDPDYRWRNALWDKYYAPTLQARPAAVPSVSEFHTVYGHDVAWHDRFYRFLQNVYRLYPEDRFHTLIKDACQAHRDDEAIYRFLQARLSGIKPFLSELFYALPSLAKQKREMTRQTLELLGARREVNGYVEIGSTGRYVSDLRRHLDIRGPLWMVHEAAPTNSPVDIAERGQLGKIGRYVPLDDYTPIAASGLPDGSVDLVTCFIGLHHCEPSRLDAFVGSIRRLLRPGGTLVLRDHDVTSPAMDAFVALAHTVFNAGLDLPWETNRAERRHFAPVAEWSRRLQAAGFRDTGHRLLQAHDPTANTLMGFVRAS